MSNLLRLRIIRNCNCSVANAQLCECTQEYLRAIRKSCQCRRRTSRHLRTRTQCIPRHARQHTRPPSCHVIRVSIHSCSGSRPDLLIMQTYAGWVLFAVNPFCNCEELYSPAWCEKYFRKSIGQEPPHPFAISATAFSRLISGKVHSVTVRHARHSDKESQYILVSGESGSGKTECSKVSNASHGTGSSHD